MIPFCDFGGNAPMVKNATTANLMKNLGLTELTGSPTTKVGNFDVGTATMISFFSFARGGQR